MPSCLVIAPSMAASSVEILTLASERAGSAAALARALRYDRAKQERLYRAIRGEVKRVGHDLVSDAKEYLAETSEPSGDGSRETLASFRETEATAYARECAAQYGTGARPVILFTVGHAVGFTVEGTWVQVGTPPNLDLDLTPGPSLTTAE